MIRIFPQVLLTYRAATLKFSSDRRGSVALLFALSAIPMLLMIGVAVDYGRILNAQTLLDKAADAAALAAVSKSGNPKMNLPETAKVEDYFRAALGTMKDGTTYTVTAQTSTSVTSLFVTVNYTASVPTTLMNLVGRSSVALSGTATAAGDFPKYIDFYLLLDNSPSMGLAATTSDISNMQARAGGCAFACHQHQFNNNGKITGDNASDNYNIAKKYNITTRIDVLRTATQKLTETATDAQTVPNQYRMAVYTFSDVFQQIASLSSNLASVQNSAGEIDLAYAYYNERDTQTDFSSALSYMNSAVPSSGDGNSQSAPMKFVFIVTDGVEDKPVKSASGSGNVADKWTNGSSGWSSNTQPNVANTQAGNVNSTRLIQTLTPSLCSTLKNKSVKIAVLYTTYLPVPTNDFYNQWVKPLASTIPANLKSCASPGFYFEVSPAGGISEAMQQMFQSALSSARLTN